MYQALIVGLEHCAPADRAALGGKITHLAQLVRTGLPVPPGFALVATALEAHCHAIGLKEPLRALDARLKAASTGSPDPLALNEGPELSAVLLALQQRIRETPFAPELEKPLRAAVRELLRGRSGITLAVRSSGAGEDSHATSFAGQYDTVLNVRDDTGVMTAVKEVWASALSERVVRYRLQQGGQLLPLELAVLVQVMVVPEVSGVIFTANPVTGSRGELVIEAGYGLGEAYVSGQLTPDTYTLSRPGGLTSELGLMKGVVGKVLQERLRLGRPKLKGRRIVEKLERMVADPKQPGRLKLEPVPVALQQVPAASEALLQTLGRQGLEIERMLGGPQDIEWAQDQEGRVWVLQARPITALRERAWTRRDTVLWTRRFFGERWTEPASPLGWSILEPILDHFVAFDAISARYLQGTPPLKRVDGHVYFNLTIFRHLVWKVKGFAPPRFIWEFFPRDEQEDMLGAPAILPNLTLVTDIFKEVIRTRRWERYHWNFFTNYQAWDAFLPVLLQAIDALPEETLDVNEARALLNLGAEWVRAYIKIHMLSLLFAHLYYEGLESLLRRRLGEDVGELLADLTTWPGENKTIETHRALRHLAQVASSSAPLRDRLMQEGPCTRAELAHLPGGEPFLVSLDIFLRAYGHRAGASWEIFSPRWCETPDVVLQMVGGLLRAGAELDPGYEERHRLGLRHKAEERALAAMPWTFPIRRLLLLHALQSTRAYMNLRENQRFYFDKLLLRIKQVAESLGGHLVQAGVLTAASDVSLLTLEELDGILRDQRAGKLELQRVHGLLRERRGELERAHMQQPDAFLEGPDATQPVISADTGSLCGLGISPGRVTGRVRILNHWRELDRLQKGDILVTRATDPGWTFLFLTAGGLVTELGSLLSHGAVVAREYGLPAVVNVPDATRLLKDGQRVTLDGSRGTLFVHEDE